jgi:hypothetical protein
MYLNDAEQSKAKEDIVSLIAYIFGEGLSTVSDLSMKVYLST